MGIKIKTEADYRLTRDNQAEFFGQLIPLDFAPQTRAQYLRQLWESDPYGVRQSGKGIVGPNAHALDRELHEAVISAEKEGR